MAIKCATITPGTHSLTKGNDSIRFTCNFELFSLLCCLIPFHLVW